MFNISLFSIFINAGTTSTTYKDTYEYTHIQFFFVSSLFFNNNKKIGGSDLWISVTGWRPSHPCRGSSYDAPPENSERNVATSGRHERNCAYIISSAVSETKVKNVRIGISYERFTRPHIRRVYTNLASDKKRNQCTSYLKRVGG